MRRRPVWWLRPPAIVVLMAALATACVEPGTGSGHPASPHRIYGTLQSEPQHAPADFGAGLRAAEVDVSWKMYEPARGQFDAGYVTSITRRIDALRQQGFSVSVGLGLGSAAPGWVLDLPNGQLLDQYGNRSGPNFQWSEAVRAAAEVYLREVLRALRPASIYSIRVGFAPDAGELLYPPSRPQLNSLWAFDDAAQRGGPGLADGARRSPFPGWRPGDRTYAGRPFTIQQVGTWYRWYVDALAEAGNWEVEVLEEAGYHGRLAWLLPGPGVLPHAYDDYVHRYLTGSTWRGDPAPRGGSWNVVAEDIRDRAHTQLQNTGIGDASGGNSGCEPRDRLVRIDDVTIDGWSGGRWTSYLADRYGMHKAGENPGPHDTVGVTRAANHIFLSCGMDVWYFAFDFSLHDGYPGAAQLDDLAAIIRSSGGA